MRIGQLSLALAFAALIAPQASATDLAHRAKLRVHHHHRVVRAAARALIARAAPTPNAMTSGQGSDGSPGAGSADGRRTKSAGCLNARLHPHRRPGLRFKGLARHLARDPFAFVLGHEEGAGLVGSDLDWRVGLG
jgi:hypothetical protein